jgi:tetratricopeptide (TPR) repeat protein
MKKIVLCTIGLLVCGCVVGQNRCVYEELVARAGLYHLQSDYRHAMPLFEKAFQIRPPDSLNAYKAAAVYALDSNTEKAFRHLHLALKSGWREAGALTDDPYFRYLRVVDSAKWREIMDSATLLE